MNKQTIEFIRLRGSVPESISDSEITRLVALGDKLREKMEPGSEEQYDETQQRAINYSSLAEIAAMSDLDDFNFEKFDEEFDKEFGLSAAD